MASGTPRPARSGACGGRGESGEDQVPDARTHLGRRRVHRSRGKRLLFQGGLRGVRADQRGFRQLGPVPDEQAFGVRVPPRTEGFLVPAQLQTCGARRDAAPGLAIGIRPRDTMDDVRHLFVGREVALPGLSPARREVRGPLGAVTTRRSPAECTTPKPFSASRGDEPTCSVRLSALNTFPGSCVQGAVGGIPWPNIADRPHTCCVTNPTLLPLDNVGQMCRPPPVGRSPRDLVSRLMGNCTDPAAVRYSVCPRPVPPCDGQSTHGAAGPAAGTD